MFLCACAFTRIEICTFSTFKKFVKARVYETYSAFYIDFQPPL